MTDRLRSGIEPLDDLLHGGLPAAAINLITGPPGSGKTMLAHQYVFATRRLSVRRSTCPPFPSRSRR